MYKNLIPIMAAVRKWGGKICLAFLFRVSLLMRKKMGHTMVLVSKILKSDSRSSYLFSGCLHIAGARFSKHR